MTSSRRRAKMRDATCDLTARFFEGPILKLPFGALPFGIQMANFAGRDIARCNLRTHVIHTVPMYVAFAGAAL